MVSPLLEQAPWLTPTSLFVLLNVVIATILVSTSFNKPNKSNKERTLSEGDTASPQPSNPPQLRRAPSLFSRVTSFNFSNYYPDNDNDDYNHQHHQQHQHQQQQLPHIKSAPSFFSRVASFKMLGRVEPDPDQEVTREVVPEPKQGLEPRAVPRAPSLLSRVASFTMGGRSSTQGEMGEMDTYRTINRNDVSNNNVNKGKKKKKTTKEVEAKTTTTSLKKEKNEEEVDAKADDFINRFKQQLKLQRIESLMRRQSA